MWLALFGSGWIWGALVVAALLSFVASIAGFLFLIIMKPAQRDSSELVLARRLDKF